MTVVSGSMTGGALRQTNGYLILIMIAAGQYSDFILFDIINESMFPVDMS